MTNPVVVDYSSRDYASIQNDLIRQIPNFLPEWTSRSSSDFGIVLLELFAYVGDILSYYIDRVANESYLPTAVQRSSVLTIAAMLDYRPRSASPSTVQLQFITPVATPTTVVPKGTQVQTAGTTQLQPVMFETDEDLTILGIDAATPNYIGYVTATQGTTYKDETVGSSSGAVNQQFKLFNSPVIDRSIQLFVDETGTPALWRFVDHILDSGPTDTVYTTWTDENDIVHILFGDGINGKVPNPGGIITATYRVGGGSFTNVGANTIKTILGGPGVPTLVSVTNPANASGGDDIESLDSIRLNAPRAIATLNRAVTLADYATLSLKVSGVLHASADAQVYTNILLYICPVGGGNPTSDLTNEVLDYLATRKMINASITVYNPTYIGVNITAAINVLPQYNRLFVQQNVSNSIVELFTLNLVDFGQRITLSSVYRAINSIEGVDYGTVSLLAREDGVQSGTDDAVMDISEIPKDGIIIVSSTGGLLGT